MAVSASVSFGANVNLFMQTTDRVARTKRSNAFQWLFEAAKRRNSPDRKHLPPRQPKVDLDTLKTALKRSPPKRPVQVHRALTAPPRIAVDVSAPQGGAAPKPPGMAVRVADMLELKKEVGAWVAAEACKGLEADQRLTSIKTRRELLARIDTQLAALENGARADMSSVAELRKRLTGLAIDLALPELARERRRSAGATLEQAHEKLAETLMGMRADMRESPAHAKTVTDGFLRALAATRELRDPDTPADSRAALAEQLARGLWTGAVSIQATPLAHMDDASVRALLSAFRGKHYADNAARAYVSGLSPEDRDALAPELSNGELAQRDAASIRKLLPERLHIALDKAAAAGREAAKLREDFDAQRDRAVRVLGADNARLAEASALLRARGARKMTDDGSSGSATEDEVAAALRRLAKTNREGAFQVARLALVMERLAKAEQGAFGTNQFGLDTKKAFSARAIFDITGVSEADIEKLGYADADIDGFHRNMERLGKAGLVGVDQAARTVSRMRSAGRTMQNRDVQDTLDADLRRQPAALAKLTQREIASDILGYVRSIPDIALEMDDAKALGQGFQGVAEAVQEALFKRLDGPDSEVGVELDRLRLKVKDLDAQRRSATEEIAAVETAMARHEKALADYAQTHGKIDAKSPSGLRSAKRILLANAYDTHARGEGKRSNNSAKARDRLLSDLAGFDPNVLKRRAFSGSAAPRMEDIRKLQKEAEAIVYLRETGPERLAELRAERDQIDADRRALIVERRSLAPSLFEAAQRIVHAAILAKIPHDQKPATADAAFEPSHDMAARRKEVVEQLQEWGLAPEKFETEIDEALSQPITGDVISTWRQAVAERSMDDLLGTKIAAAEANSAGRRLGRLAKDGAKLLANTHAVDPQVQRELVALVEALKDNSKIEIAAGRKLALNTGRIPLEISGTVTVRARLEGSVFDGLTLEKGGSGEIKIFCMLGGSAKVGVDARAALMGFKSSFAKFGVGAEISLEAGYEAAGGVQLSFPKGAEGQRAAIEAIMALMDWRAPSARILEGTTDVADFARRKADVTAKGGAYAEVSAHVKRGGDKHGFKASASVWGTAAKGGKTEVSRSLDKTIIKTETKTVIGVTARAALYNRTFTALGMAGHQVKSSMSATAPLGAGTIGVEATVASIHKKKLEFEAVGVDGKERLTKAELKELVETREGVDKIIAAFPEKLLAKLHGDDAKLAQVRSMLAEIERFGWSSSMVEVTYTLDEDRLAFANDLSLDADRADDPKAAETLRSAARRIADDRENYTPTRISLIDKSSVANTANLAAAVLFKIDSTSSVGAERVVMSVALN